MSKRNVRHMPQYKNIFENFTKIVHLYSSAFCSSVNFNFLLFENSLKICETWRNMCTSTLD